MCNALTLSRALPYKPSEDLKSPLALTPSFQEYIVVEDYKSTEKDGIKLEEGMIVEVIEKNNTG